MKRRMLLAMLVLVCGIAGIIYLSRHEPGTEGLFLPCIFHEVTGWHCPGCGMTRAAHELTQFRLGEAFRKNPLAMAVLPLVAVALALEALGWITGGRYRVPRVRLPLGAPWVVLAVVISYWVLRNVPAWPFTMLAPN
jgi:hypothetical protein